MIDTPEAHINAKLEDGEQLRWSGRPRQGLLIQPMDLAVMPFSLLWAGFAFYWEYEVVSTHQFWVLQLWGIPFVLLGLYLLVGRFFTDAAVRGRTYYGLTDRRALIVNGPNTLSLPLADLKGVALDAKADGSGSVVLGPPGMPPPSRISTYYGYARVQYPMFKLIPDAQTVYDQIQALRSGSQAQSA